MEQIPFHLQPVQYYPGTTVELGFHEQHEMPYPELTDMSFLNLSGWFGPTQSTFIKKKIDSLSDGAHIVEIGVWMGRSAVFTAQCIKDSGKDITYTVIDTFKGSQNETEHINTVADHGGSIRHIFDENTKHLKDYMRVKEMTSSEAAEWFTDRSLDLVFIDGDHSFDGVYSDIMNYLPLIKKGGTLAGDDYHPVWGVFNAVSLTLGTRNIHVFGQIWIYNA